LARLYLKIGMIIASEKNRLRRFEDVLLRRIFGLERGGK
jgi:hypothetical protein